MVGSSSAMPRAEPVRDPLAQCSTFGQIKDDERSWHRSYIGGQDVQQLRPGEPKRIDIARRIMPASVVLKKYAVRRDPPSWNWSGELVGVPSLILDQGGQPCASRLTSAEAELADAVVSTSVGHGDGQIRHCSM
jgi:hypothetical protein